ncbi:ring-cleaving dioxygenase [Bacillaceae bacterium S4-13-56]
MGKKSMGIHHITAIVGHPQENVDFYAGILGLRLVKQTVNFDDPGTYHLYFGNQTGQPGTIITFFPWAGAQKGKIGGGQVGVTTYVVPLNSFDFWKKRLDKYKINYAEQTRFDEKYIQFEDPHGLQLELVEREEGAKNPWVFGEVNENVAIKGFGGAILYSIQPEKTAELLEQVMGLDKIAEEGELIRFRAQDNIGNIIDIKKTPTERGGMGVGIVHHIAWRSKDDEDQLDWKKHIQRNGYLVTPVKDRNYFNSIYFREHGQILFEIATDPPGFTHDESKETMGEKLMLPEQYEQDRSQIEKILLPLEVRNLE